MSDAAQNPEAAYKDTRTHSKDIGRKPGVIHLLGDEGSAESKYSAIECDHIDPHDGYVFTIQSGEIVYYPWRRVVKIWRDR